MLILAKHRDKQEQQRGIRRRMAVRPFLRVALVAMICSTGWLTDPTLSWLQWLYHLDRANSALEQGLRWPTPLTINSFPSIQDTAAVARAASHLAAAQSLQPGRDYPYRLAGYIDMARRDWRAAAESFGRAHELAPSNPLSLWEQMLAEEQAWSVVRHAPRETLLSKLASVPVVAATPIVNAGVCRDAITQPCFPKLTRFAQPYAALPQGPVLTADVMLMEPGAVMRLTRTVQAHTPALQFLVGLDPNLAHQVTGTAVFEVMVESPGAGVVPVYRHDLDSIVARQGWEPAWVDLTHWVGQNITLVFRITTSSSASTLPNAYGWADVVLTTRESAELSRHAPAARTWKRWEALGLDPTQFVARGDALVRQGELAAAAGWYTRARLETPILSPSSEFRAAVAHVVTGQANMEVIAPVLHIQPVADGQGTQIEAENLQFLATPVEREHYDGQLLVAAESVAAEVGVLPWSGAGITALDVATPGTYRITLRAQHVAPSPIKLQIEQNGMPIGAFDLMREDNTWQEYTISAEFDSGTHIIGVRFLNDNVVQGHDRNAVLDWLRVQPIH